jgi:hypothetical protein
VQEDAIAAILDGKNAVVLAPTAGGKTEAAFFPLLSQMDTDRLAPSRSSTSRRSAPCSTTRKTASRATRASWAGARSSGTATSAAGDKAFLRDPSGHPAHHARVARGDADEPQASRRASCSRPPRGGHRRDPRVRGDDRGGAPRRRDGATVPLLRPRPPAHRPLRDGRQPGRHPRLDPGSSRTATGRIVDPKGGGKQPQIALDYVATLPNAAW